MQTNKTLKIPFFQGNIRFIKCEGTVSLERFIKAHREPSYRTEAIIEEIKVASKNNDHKLKRELKQKLVTFTPSVFFEVGVERRYSNVTKWTGLMQLDFDKMANEDASELKHLLFKTYPQIVCCWISPSGNGVKALMRIKVPKDSVEYKAIHAAVEKEMEQYSYFDVATKNAVLPLFLGMDYDILYRDFSECDEWTESILYTKVHENLSDVKVSKYNPNFQKTLSDKYYEKITVDIFEKKINAISDCGHPQLRSACLIIGSRAGAGYIDINDAMTIATNAIHSNEYLNKNIKGYVETACWAINQGYSKPKYYSKR
jgi:hypothetical protein